MITHLTYNVWGIYLIGVGRCRGGGGGGEFYLTAVEVASECLSLVWLWKFSSILKVRPHNSHFNLSCTTCERIWTCKALVLRNGWMHKGQEVCLDEEFALVQECLTWEQRVWKIVPQIEQGASLSDTSWWRCWVSRIFLEKSCLQNGHSNGRWPVWVRKWIFKSPECIICLRQNSIGQKNVLRFKCLAITKCWVTSPD